jgi:acetyl esterase/lipase
MRSLSVSLLSIIACILAFFGWVLALGACGNSSPPPPMMTMMMPGPPPPAELHFLTRADPNDSWMETQSAFWGNQVAVRFAHLPAGTVTVAATSSSYASSADFAVGDDGALALDSAAPQSGSWSGADADGLFWSMSSSDPNAFEDFDVVVSATAGGTPVISATLHRTWGPDGVKPLMVSDSGLVGEFVAPAGGGTHPAIIAFGGSEGGLGTGALLAEYYASLGYSCLGLAYFGATGVPSTLSKIPLEYFAKAIAWLKARPEVDPSRIAVMGGSRGGELALLLGATYPDIKMVVATVPSGVVWGGTTNTPTAAWTLGGKELPYIPSSGAMPMSTTDAAGDTIFVDAPVFLADLAAASPAAKDAATIAVEKTAGPILMLAGADDQLWASCKLSQVAVDRLNANGHTAKWNDDFQCYDATGHNVTTPDLPTTNASLAWFPDVAAYFLLGGTPAGIAHAARESDTRIRRFLKRL